jgi:hypothetical protein
MMVVRPAGQNVRLLSKLLLVVGLITLGVGAYYGLGYFMVARWADSSGIDVDWVNVFASSFLYVLLGAAPLAAGVMLFLSYRKPDRMEKQ